MKRINLLKSLLFSLTLITGFSTLLSAKSIFTKGDENINISKAERIEDVVIVDSKITVYGAVTGVIYAVNSTVTIEKGASCPGKLTIIKGKLHINDNNIKPEEIVLADTETELSMLYLNGALVPIEKDSLVQIGSHSISVKKQKTSHAIVMLLQRYLIFSRSAPAQNYTPNQLLNMLSLNRYGFYAKSTETVSEIKLSVLFPGIDNADDLIKGVDAAIKTFESKQYSEEIKIIIIRFKGYKEATEFWNSKIRRVKSKQISFSCNNSFGDGAHWFFRINSATDAKAEKDVALWYNTHYFFGVLVPIIIEGPMPRQGNFITQDVIPENNFRDSLVESIQNQVKNK